MEEDERKRENKAKKGDLGMEDEVLIKFSSISEQTNSATVPHKWVK